MGSYVLWGDMSYERSCRTGGNFLLRNMMLEMSYMMTSFVRFLLNAIILFF